MNNKHINQCSVVLGLRLFEVRGKTCTDFSVLRRGCQTHFVKQLCPHKQGLEHFGLSAEMVISVHVLSTPLWTLALFQFPCKSLRIAPLIYNDHGLAFPGATRITSVCEDLTLNPCPFSPRQFWHQWPKFFLLF